MRSARYSRARGPNGRSGSPSLSLPICPSHSRVPVGDPADARFSFADLCLECAPQGTAAPEARMGEADPPACRFGDFVRPYSDDDLLGVAIAKHVGNNGGPLPDYPA